MTLTADTGADECTTARRRATRLDALLGDPYDPVNPHGFAAFAAADRDRRPPRDTELLLAEAGLAAEFVPARYGGALTRADLLMRVLRPVFRRDVALGFGCGVTSLFAASAVWTAGSDAQRRATAGLLLRGGRATVVHPGLTTGGGVLRDGFTVRRPAGGGLSLSGRKDVIIDAGRADAYVVHARTAAPGPRDHSVLLLDPARLPDERAHRLPRVATTGMRGAVFSGLRFADCPVPDDALVGRPGEGATLALRTNQVNRCLVAGAVLAAVDPVLRAAVRAATEGRTGPPARRWHRPLAGVFTDLLACDAMATVCLRATSLLPDRAHVPAVAATYVVPTLLADALEELSTLLGAPGGRAGDLSHGTLAKLVRDLPAAGLGPAGAAACQAVIVPQLRALATRSWFAEAEPPPGLFRALAELPPLDHSLLTFAEGGDFLAASLAGSAERLARARSAGGPIALLGRLADAFLGELRLLREQCAALPGRFGAALSGPAASALSDRYGLVVTAAAVLGVWEGQEQEGDAPFLADPGWAVLALSRLGRRLGIAVPDVPADCVAGVVDELLRRHRTGRGLDLDGIELAR
ncbi:acyl-CoA dehydrogenase [Streptomyces piniterrae]|uniref:Acyl-CoA dehydrogenase n=1 Tax=Streptomyces piniterrae TaxID=2571125 RepID=A0A4U0NDN3_9ACTN|nr:acyl-CoA dehydrogenase family protein [Streptomyces piniterrae]TJZ52119.1 acyl-CoA dehydrogenase [Streptomyces piniterrae]